MQGLQAVRDGGEIVILILHTVGVGVEIPVEVHGLILLYGVAVEVSAYLPHGDGVIEQHRHAILLVYEIALMLHLVSGIVLDGKLIGEVHAVAREMLVAAGGGHCQQQQCGRQQTVYILFLHDALAIGHLVSGWEFTETTSSSSRWSRSLSVIGTLSASSTARGMANVHDLSVDRSR